MSSLVNSAPMCDVCGHCHYPNETCSVCGHNNQKVYRGPPPTTLWFEFIKHPERNKGKKFRKFQLGYHTVQILRHKVQLNDYSACAPIARYLEGGSNPADDGSLKRAFRKKTGLKVYRTDEKQALHDRVGHHGIGYFGHAPIMVGSITPTMVDLDNNESLVFACLENIGILADYRGRGCLRKFLDEAKSYILQKSDNIAGFVVDCPSERLVGIFAHFNFVPCSTAKVTLNNGQVVVKMAIRF
jgi:hypothetical protein